MLSLWIHFTDQEHIALLSNIREPFVLSKESQISLLKSLPAEMAPSRKMFYFVLAFFFMLAQFPSGKRVDGILTGQIIKLDDSSMYHPEEERQSAPHCSSHGNS